MHIDIDCRSPGHPVLAGYDRQWFGLAQPLGAGVQGPVSKMALTNKSSGVLAGNEQCLIYNQLMGFCWLKYVCIYIYMICIFIFIYIYVYIG